VDEDKTKLSINVRFENPRARERSPLSFQDVEDADSCPFQEEEYCRIEVSDVISETSNLAAVGSASNPNSLVFSTKAVLTSM
jgi:hypothetical protein